MLLWQNIGLQQKNDGGRLFLFHAVNSSHWQTESGIGRNVPWWQKWTWKTPVQQTVRRKMSGWI